MTYATHDDAVAAETILHREQQQDELVFFKRPDAPPTRQRLIVKSDLHRLVQRAIETRIVSGQPQASWKATWDMTARVRRSKHMRRTFPRWRRGLEAACGPMTDDAAMELFDAWRRMKHAASCALTQDRLRPDSLMTRLEGAEHLGAGGERGTLLWAAPFCFQNILGKRALAEGGILGHQVSVVSHGPSDSVLGLRWVNRRWIEAENRYLAGRLVFAHNETSQVIRRVLRLLSAGETVIVTNNAFTGSSFVRLPFGRGAQIAFATTPVVLALRYGFSLHCITTLSRRPLFEVTTRISPDLTAGMTDAAGMPGIAQVVRAVRDSMFDAAAAEPAQFLSWQALGTETGEEGQRRR